MPKKSIFLFIIILMILTSINIWAQTSRFERVFRDINDNLLTGATIYIVHHDTGDSLKLNEDGTRDGVYYLDNVVYGNYKIYINGALRIQKYYFGTVRQRDFIESVDPDANNLIDGVGIEDSTITGAKLAPSLYNLLTSDTLINNPDEITLENKSGNTIGIKYDYYPDSIAFRIEDSLDVIRNLIGSGTIVITKGASATCWQGGDSLDFEKLTASGTKYFDMDLPVRMDGYYLTLDSIWIHTLGDNQSYIDGITVKYNYFGLSNAWFNFSNDTCTGSNKKISYNTSNTILDEQGADYNNFILKIDCNVNQYIKFFTFKYFLSK